MSAVRVQRLITVHLYPNPLVMWVQIASLHVHLHFIIGSDSESVACVTELAHRVAVNTRETESYSLPASPA